MELVTRKKNGLAALNEAAKRRTNNTAFTHDAENKSKNTLRTHLAALKLFADYINHLGAKHGVSICPHELQTNGEEWDGITAELVLEFINEMKQVGYAISSINSRLTAIKTYARLAGSTGGMDANEALRITMIESVSANANEHREQTRLKKYSYERNGRIITRNGNKKKDHNVLTIAQVERLTAADSYYWETNAVGTRDRLIMLLLSCHALRVSEVAILTTDSFDMKNRTMTFYRPKTKLWQTHNLSDTVYHAVVDCLEWRNAYINSETKQAYKRLFIASTRGQRNIGTPMSRDAIAFRVQKLGEKLLDLVNLSPHDLRHFCINDAKENGASDDQLQELGGWKDRRMVDRYTEKFKFANAGIKSSIV